MPIGKNYSNLSMGPIHDNAILESAMYLSKLKIKNFRQCGAGEPVFSVPFHTGVTALVGENDTGKTAVIDAIRHVLLTRDMEFMAAADRRLSYPGGWAASRRNRDLLQAVWPHHPRERGVCRIPNCCGPRT
jgi:uncharacterized protein YPO0396